MVFPLLMPASSAVWNSRVLSLLHKHLLESLFGARPKVGQSSALLRYDSLFRTMRRLYFSVHEDLEIHDNLCKQFESGFIAQVHLPQF